jgi:hypothetical protein
MLETSARLLRLLSLLQSRRDWTGAELATGSASPPAPSATTWTGCAGSATRSTRGRAWPAATGSAPAAALPPLLLDDDEAVAVAIGLRTAASGSIAGIEETSVRALAKLQQSSRPGCATGSAPSSRTRCRCRRPAAGGPGRADRDRRRLPGP